MSMYVHLGLLDRHFNGLLRNEDSVYPSSFFFSPLSPPSRSPTKQYGSQSSSFWSFRVSFQETSMLSFQCLAYAVVFLPVIMWSLAACWAKFFSICFSSSVRRLARRYQSEYSTGLGLLVKKTVKKKKHAGVVHRSSSNRSLALLALPAKSSMSSPTTPTATTPPGTCIHDIQHTDERRLLTDSESAVWTYLAVPPTHLLYRREREERQRDLAHVLYSSLISSKLTSRRTGRSPNHKSKYWDGTLNEPTVVRAGCWIGLLVNLPIKTPTYPAPLVYPCLSVERK